MVEAMLEGGWLVAGVVVAVSKCQISLDCNCLPPSHVSGGSCGCVSVWSGTGLPR